MGIKRIGGFIFKIFVTDHAPYHVHVYYKDKELGRFDIENQKPMDKNLIISGRLKKALQKAGYFYQA